ncbi:WXG100 family type VII secretion target [Nakamurella sp. PAMC28650]|uniref:WXG100 family type VII secretion target n=1 Tax=Nakamurella sp. PAMC28650 TaxID=2762325 RepID=UPI00164E9096|nr:WXG100 family type VII secretion target [Nakamurella sp. PAMC28650]QNK82994.1 WXG100 family type VII secretion target [Nakamurella sp. PAMC28650]
MSNFVGMDVAEVRDVAKRFDANAEQLEVIVQRLDQLVKRASGSWHGHDSATFAHLWSGQYRSELQATQSALAEMGRALTRNADEQDRASAADPGSGAAGIGVGNAGPVATTPDSPRVAGLKQDLAYAKLVDAAGSGSTTLPPGYEKVSPNDLEKLGLTGYKTSGITGMDVSVYRDANGHYVVAFPGSSTGASSVSALWDSGMDWVVNNVAGAGGISPQEMQAVAIAQAITSHVGADNVTFAGHSLGGQTAALASMVSGSHAVTFNAASISAVVADFPGLREGAAGLITNYETSNDPLSDGETYGALNPSVGRTVVVPGTKDWYDVKGNHGTGMIEAGIQSQIDQAEKAK